MNVNKSRMALLTLALGFWLIALPLTFGYRGHILEWSDIVSGFLLIFFGLLCMAPARSWSGWFVGILGVWLQMAPLIFWAPTAQMYLNDTLVGAIAVILSFQLTKKDVVDNGSSCPPGWSYNPSGWAHRVPTVALAMLCWFFSRYMAAFQLGYIDSIWDPFFKDGTFHVITSSISRDFPVSDAGMGALCYTLEFLLGWQGGSRRYASMPWLVFAFAFLVIPVGIVSITLIILQPVVVGAWCSWCLATAACMLFMIVLTGGELIAALQNLREVRKRGDSVWLAFWKGTPVEKKQARRKEPPMSQNATGVSIPWNLAVSLGLGVWMILSPSVLGTFGSLSTLNYILGPLITAISVIALAEVFRAVRYLNILLGLVLLIGPWLFPGNDALNTANSLLVGVAILGLSISRGTITERYGAWDRFIM